MPKKVGIGAPGSGAQMVGRFSRNYCACGELAAFDLAVEAITGPAAMSVKHNRSSALSGGGIWRRRPGSAAAPARPGRGLRSNSLGSDK